MVYSFPTTKPCGPGTPKIRGESLRAEHGLADATQFYRTHREEMDGAP